MPCLGIDLPQETHDLARGTGVLSPHRNLFAQATPQNFRSRVPCQAGIVP